MTRLLILAQIPIALATGIWRQALLAAAQQLRATGDLLMEIGYELLYVDEQRAARIIGRATFFYALGLHLEHRAGEIK